jgi:hypothetical protein
MTTSTTLTAVVLETGPDGRARFREEQMTLNEVKPQLYLSALVPSSGFQVRQSPPGYQMGSHCTVNPGWNFVLAGALEFTLPDGTRRVFRAGARFYANDTLPEGAIFDPSVHGHSVRQVGEEAVVTVMLKC